ncbi:uncharacterized protein [Littorina saxatilis]|uniref:uncharacterized protein n=1 Tax=Littorina saxatilis TaxID=31220 RepID=UPI0038B463AB
MATGDELDDFLRRFERIASDQKWEEATWASRLSTCLKGRALQLYNALDDEEARDYQALKKALLQRFNLTAEAYRRRLRNSKRLSGELSHQFVARLNLYLRRWVEMAEKNWTVDDLADLIVMEQLMSSLRPEVVTFVQEHQPKTTQEAANWIRVHEDAQAISGKSSGSRPGKSGNAGSSGPKDGKDDQGHQGSSSRTDIQCFYCGKRGHVEKDCHKRQADQKGVHFVGSEEFRDVTSTCTIPQLCVPCSRKHFQPHCNVYVNGVVVPREFREGVMATAHDSILGGHLGTKKTTDRVWRHFYWPGICTDVRRFCASCDKCQKVVAKVRVRKVPLEKMPLIDEPFHRVAVDIIGPILPASEDGNRYILTMVDYATRYPEAIPLKSIEATRVAEALVTMWSRLGIPSEVLTDRGTQFTGGVMAEAARLLSLEQHFTTPYHAQCNGLVERFNG